MALLPLESNPDVMNKFLHLLGVPNKWNIIDVYGLDEDALAWVPSPALALILLYPCNEKSDEYSKSLCEKLKSEGQEISPKLFYMRQYVSNACGTIALLHSVANNVERIGLSDGPFKRILDEARDLTPEKRGELLLQHSPENSEVFNIIMAHQELAMEGQTEVAPNMKVNHHFVALVEKDGYLYELDGRKDVPVNHGPTTPDNFLKDAAKVCRDFIARDSDDVNFTVMALAGQAAD